MIVRRRSDAADKLEGAARKIRNITSNKLATSQPQSGDLNRKKNKEEKK